MKEQIRHDLELFLADNCQAWVLHGDGSYERVSPESAKPVSAQDTFLRSLSNLSSTDSSVFEHVAD
jgi:polyphosphate kinase